MTHRSPQCPRRMAARRRVIASLGVAVALAVAACATPSGNPDRAEANQERQKALEQMERAGQRNDDRPLRQ
ncbi:MAG: hypothetical protein U1F58_19925 [Burkholderiales bacterium]